MNTSPNYDHELSKHLLTAKTTEQMDGILHEILTPSEFTEISKRLHIFRLLQTGMPQRQIADTLGDGIATVTRGSRALQERQK